MKSTNFFLSFYYLLILTIISSCQKGVDRKIENPIKNSNLLKLINEFNPNHEKARTLYYSFENEIAVSNKDFKNIINAEDRYLNEAIWIIGATINKNYGFIKDSVEYLVIDTMYHTLPIKSYNSEGIPIIDGDIILQKYYDIENTITMNDENGFSFWSLALIVVEINEFEAEVMSVSSGGPKSNKRYLITPLPPGTPMTLFDDDEWLWAGGSMHPQNTRANYVYYDRINGLGPYYPLDPHIVYTYFYSFYKSAYIAPGVAESRIFWDYGMCEYRKMYGSELNQYLMSTKDLIDEYNPQYNGSSTEDLFIGWFYIECWNIPCENIPCPSPGPSNGMSWFEHAYTAQIYRKTYIGPPID